MEDAMAVAEMMVATGKIPPANRWVDDFIDQNRAEQLEGLF